MRLPTAIYFAIFEFCNFDEWMGVMYVNKSCFGCPNLLGFAKKQLRARVEKEIEFILDHHKDAFWRALQNDKGVLSGSLLLEKLLGPDKFIAGDLDIFIPSQWRFERREGGHPRSFALFADMHRVLYKAITGNELETEEIPRRSGIDFDETQIRQIQQLNREEDVPLHMQFQAWNDYGEFKVRQQPQSYKIVSVHNFPFFQKRKVQVILVNENDEKPEQYILKWFDFEINKCWVGETVKLPNLVDLFHRKIRLDAAFLDRAQLYDQNQTQRHQARLQRYQERGFRCDSFEYGKLSPDVNNCLFGLYNASEMTRAIKRQKY